MNDDRITDPEPTKLYQRAQVIPTPMWEAVAHDGVTLASARSKWTCRRRAVLPAVLLGRRYRIMLRIL